MSIPTTGLRGRQGEGKQLDCSEPFSVGRRGCTRPELAPSAGSGPRHAQREDRSFETHTARKSAGLWPARTPAPGASKSKIKDPPSIKTIGEGRACRPKRLVWQSTQRRTAPIRETLPVRTDGSEILWSRTVHERPVRDPTPCDRFVRGPPSRGERRFDFCLP